VPETATILRQEVQRQGIISFARFMELALYCPDSGYYEQPERRIGRAGDFYTSVSAGSLFGELLAYQFSLWMGAGRASRQQMVEAGAHDGQLALDVLSWTALHRPALFETLEYWLVEPSRQRQAWQREKLDKFAGRVRWVETLDGLPTGGIEGVIFSNELLDAFPVHRVSWDANAGNWFEWGVVLAGDEFIWRRLPGEARDWSVDLKQAGFDLQPALLKVLPDGFTLELSPSAADWWREASLALRNGQLLTFDYGFTALELFAPERSRGTLRAYHQHRASENILARPGEQDITAHVNFSRLQSVGESAGLKTEAFSTQARFLTSIAKSIWGGASGGAAPSPRQARQFQTLTHPAHLGQSFRVLVQSR
jgi:SAM-dependent MidA family methyltransferase